MAKRVFQVAKEIGITSKAIVAKCHAEGIPDSVIKNHMSSVSAGLEETIHAWFGDQAAAGTAIETAEKVDLDKARAKPKRAKSASARNDAGDESDSGGTAVATAEPAVDDSSAASASAPTAAPAPGEGPSAGADTDTSAPTDTPAEAANDAVAPAKPAPTVHAAPPASAPAPAAQTPGATDTPSDTSPEAIAPDAGSTPDGGSSASSVKMNIPDRPKVITPAGPQLNVTKQVKAKLSGPKVVRVEAPERLEPPRPRRTGPRVGGPGGGPGGGGMPRDPMAMPGMPDGGRSPRRGGNKRRKGGEPEPARRTGRTGGEGAGVWSQQDLAEREARLARSGGYMKQRRQQLKRQQQGGTKPATPAERGGKVTIVEPFTIKDLSAATGVKGADIVKALFMQGVMASINSGIDAEKAQEIMIDYDIELEVTEAKSAEDVVSDQFIERKTVDERPRGPVVTILGHVDHGKTSLLDYIRKANVASGEAGGITQATSAFRVPVTVGDESKHVVFVDTPGHEAFTEMRSRGATITDLVVLVVAADDGVMPQTIESISHAKAAGVPIVVALNKIDKPEATDSNVQKILGQLAEHDLNPTEWGGDTEVVRTSATKGEGVQELLDILDFQSQLLELTADHAGQARGSVIESRMQEGRGAVANILVQEGELKVGDFVVAGRAFGRVRDITDDRGKRHKQVSPPIPVQISGLDVLPDAGDKIYAVESLKQAQNAAEQRRSSEREAQLAQPKVTLDSLFGKIAESAMKEILIVLKADVQGSIDVLKNEVEKITTDEVKVRVIHAAVGGITESDVLLAEASEAIIVGFNVIASSKARTVADQKGVEIRNYQVIYHITEDITKAAEGLLEPELRQEVLGHAEVRQVFKVSKVGSVAGCYVTDGVVQRDALIRVTRADVVVENDRKLEQLKRFKDDAKEVRSGMECGMKIVGYDDIKEGDILECYKNVEVKRTL